MEIPSPVQHGGLDDITSANQYLVSITIMIRLERPFAADPDIACLLGGQLGELHTKLFKVKHRHFLIEMLGKDINLIFIMLAARPKLNLGKHLIGEA